MSPKTGVPGDEISVFGKNFGPAPGEILIGGISADPLVWTDSFIKCVLPDLPLGKQQIEVITRSGVAKANVTLLGLAPVITSINPKSGSVGTTVLIDGQGFGATQDTSTITVGGLAADVVFWGDKRLAIKIPDLANGNRPVIVTTASGQAQDSFRVRSLILQIERGDCDESFLGTLAETCYVLDPIVQNQRVKNGNTLVDIDVTNIRRRWYEVTIFRNGVEVGKDILGPEGRGKFFEVHLKDELVVPGDRITLFANGRSSIASGMHFLDLASIGILGSPLPGNVFDAAIGLLTVPSKFSLFGIGAGANLARGDVVAVLNDLGELKTLVEKDPVVATALKSLFKLSGKQLSEKLAFLVNVANVFKTLSIIERQMEVFVSPSFDHVALVAQ